MQGDAIHKEAAELTRNAAGLFRRVGARVGLRILLPMVIGFALARTPVPGGIYPFGAAFAAAISGGSTAAAMVGVLLGFIIPGSGAESLRCAASALAAAGIKWALSELKTIKNSPIFPPVAALAGIVLTGFVVTTSVGAAVSFDLARYLAEGTMAAACTYFFCGGIDSWRRRESGNLSTQDMYCIAASLCMVCIPLCRLSVFGFSPVAAVIMTAAIAVSKRYGASGGAAAGIALGVVLALAKMRFTLLGACALACLGASLFASVGTVAVSAVFCLGCLLGTAASGHIDIYFFAEAILAAIAFPIIKENRLSFIFDIIEPTRTVRSGILTDGYVCRRLADAARGLEEAAATVGEVSKRLERIEAPRAEAVCRHATEDICADCAISRFCWETSREESRRLFDSLCGILRQDGRLTRNNTPDQMRSRCARWGEMSERINALYAEFAAEENARRQVSHIRQVMAGQMQSCGYLLNEIAEKSGREERHSTELTKKAVDALGEYGIAAEDVCCLCGTDGALSVTLTLRADEEYPQPQIDAMEILSDLFETDLELTMLMTEGDSLSLRLDSRPKYSLSIGVVQHNKGGGRLCGDVYEILTDCPGTGIVLLSDGMGTGGRAAVDAAMTCRLMSSMLTAGFSEKSAMEMVNSAIQISSQEETLATLDCARIDLYTGQLTLSKAGAAASYIIRGGHAFKIEMNTLPLGIMSLVDNAEEKIYMEDGDVFVMVSDGAQVQESWIEQEIARTGTGDVHRIARDIMALARAHAGDDDDVTVIIVRLDLCEVEKTMQAA